MSTKKEKEYRRLPGRGYAGSGPVAVARVMSRLYLGKDHLLRVNASWVENYRRFYYNDIQAIIVSRTQRFLIWTIILAVLCAGFLFWCVTVHNQYGRITLACISAFFGAFLVGNGLYGPTCRVKIVTHTGSEPLPSLKRVRTARKVIALLKPEIQAAQGTLEPGEIPQRLADLQAMPQPAGKRAGSAWTNNYRGALHGWLFSALLIEALILAAFIFLPGGFIGMLLIISVFCVAGLTFVALVKQSGSLLGDGLRNVTWIALAHVILALIGGYILMVATIMAHPRIAQDQFAIIKMIGLIPVLKTPWMLVVFGFLAGSAAILALSGLIIWFGSREAIENATATDTVSS
ncbi:MAG: hypothetical protein WCD79_16660 [Chthoniobacteraceae bacterium]